MACLIFGATESGHQDSLSDARSVSSDDCLRQMVTRVGIVNRKAGIPGEQFGDVGLIFEGAAPM